MSALLFVMFLGGFLRGMAQCCAGGSGSPVAGGTSQGVLSLHQMELSSTMQYIDTHRFLDGSSRMQDFLDDYHSSYVYTRVAYGISEDFTMSAECGYWLNRTQIAIQHIDTVSGSGFADLVLFPRYTVYRNTEGTTSDEVTVGLGLKIPMGSYQDSAKAPGTEFFVRKPLAVQMSSGSMDAIFYLFLFRAYNDWNLKLYANGLYIRKGWNGVGERMGDFASFSLFAAHPIVENLSAVLQFRGEWVDSMRINQTIMDYKNPGYVAEWTGYKKIFVSPQLNYTPINGLNVSALVDIPVYQYVNGHQIASQLQASLGVSYRFFIGEVPECCR